MLQVGSPKAKLLEEKLHELDFENVKFEVLSMQGLTIKVNHNSDDATAKAVLKKFIASLPECKNSYTNIQMIDENGRII